MMVSPIDSRVTTSALIRQIGLMVLSISFRSLIWSTNTHLSERVMMVSPIDLRVTTSAQIGQIGFMV